VTLTIDLNETLTVIRQLVTLDSYSAGIQRRWRKQFPSADGSGVKSVSHEFGVRTVEVTTEDIVLVVAVTREATARAQLARQLPGESVLLMIPDYPTAVDAFGSGVLTSRLDQSAAADTVMSHGGLEIDRLGQRVAWNGNLLPLTRLERGIIGCLAEPPTQVWAHERLYRAVWQAAWLGDATALHTTVKRLRRKLREAGAPALIDSVRGVGFRLRVEMPTAADPAVRAVAPGRNAAVATPASPAGAMKQKSVRMRPSAVPAHREPRLSA
jgi:DNA-binding winged helix-turn-helix (wHTH) protein